MPEPKDTAALSEDELFRQEMGDVAPIEAKAKIAIKKQRTGTDQTTLEARRKAAVSLENKADPNFLRASEVKQVGAHDVIGFKRPGIQDGVYRKLRLGKYAFEARLDLHRKTVEMSRNEVFRFINDCIEHDVRTVMILPGKGDRNPEQPATLKSYLVHWLEELETVQAFHTAQPQHGGAGAFYVLLRKSERRKQDIRERLSKGRM